MPDLFHAGRSSYPGSAYGQGQPSLTARHVQTSSRTLGLRDCRQCSRRSRTAQSRLFWLFWFAKLSCVEDTFRAQILTVVNSARCLILWYWLLGSWCASAATTGADWPMFHGGPALTGVAATTLSDKLGLLWTFKASGPVKSSPAIVQDRVFIGSDDGNVYALALADGKPIWTF